MELTTHDPNIDLRINLLETLMHQARHFVTDPTWHADTNAAAPYNNSAEATLIRRMYYLAHLEFGWSAYAQAVEPAPWTEYHQGVEDRLKADFYNQLAAWDLSEADFDTFWQARRSQRVTATPPNVRLEQPQY